MKAAQFTVEVDRAPGFMGRNSMPGLKGKKNVSRNIKEAHKGKTYKRTLRKYGKKKADEQAIAIGMSEAGVGRKKKGKKRARAKRNVGETEI